MSTFVSTKTFCSPSCFNKPSHLHLHFSHFTIPPPKKKAWGALCYFSLGLPHCPKTQTPPMAASTWSFSQLQGFKAAKGGSFMLDPLSLTDHSWVINLYSIQPPKKNKSTFFLGGVVGPYFWGGGETYKTSSNPKAPSRTAAQTLAPALTPPAPEHDHSPLGACHNSPQRRSQ